MYILLFIIINASLKSELREERIVSFHKLDETRKNSLTIIDQFM